MLGNAIADAWLNCLFPGNFQEAQRLILAFVIQQSNHTLT